MPEPAKGNDTLLSPIAQFSRIFSRIGAAPVALGLAALMPLPVQGGKSLLSLPSLCVFHITTGLPCPGCGMTRAIVCCCHGRFADSIGYHPLGLIVFAWLVVAAVPRLPFPNSWRSRFPAIPLPLRGAGGLILVGLLFAVWGARLAGWLPSPP